MMSHVDPTFSQTGALLAYGCNCYMLGNFFGGSQSSPSKGNAVDEHDQNCKEYKECVLAAVNQYGDHCVPEMYDDV